MQVAVWDTYVKTAHGSVMHFDIVLPDTVKDTALIYGYGRQYLETKGVQNAELSASECRYCHIEEPTALMMAAIEEKGFYIIEMETITAQLPATPTRRDKILFLRAHFPQHRFAQFSGMPEAEIDDLITKAWV